MSPSEPTARRALYPGSFDPVTRGHLDVIVRAATLFERLWVGVLDNPGKVACFDTEERIGLVRESLRELGADAGLDPSAVEVVSFRGLTVDLAARLGAGWLVRGVRRSEDAADELPMAWSNRICGSRRVETVLLPTSHDLAFISSRLVRQIAAGGGRLESFVTPGVERALRRRFDVDR